MQTNIPIGSALAVKVYSVALMSRVARFKTFRKKLTGPAPKQGQAEKMARLETSSGYPIVEIKDLSKGAGERVTVDLVDIVSGSPTMGDRNISGNMMKLEFATDEVRIDQYRGGIDPGGRMSQQRTVHNLRSLAMAHLAGWANTLHDNIVHVHMAGARGYQTGRDWNVPLESAADFAEVMVNDVLPPAASRRSFAGDATSAANIDSADVLTLNFFDDLRTRIDESAYPLQGVRIEGDPAGDEEDPLYVCYLSTRQWNQLLKSTSTQNWRDFLAAAHSRGSITRHPLFSGEVGMWRGILFKKTNRAIRFPTGSVVREYDSNGALQNVTTGVDVDRAVLLGAQALACVYGQDSKSGYYWRWHEEETDHGNRVEVSASMMGGHKKLRFTIDGTVYDHGTWTIDSYAPAV